MKDGVLMIIHIYAKVSVIDIVTVLTEQHDYKKLKKIIEMF